MDVVYGSCCVCELPCVAGQELVAGGIDCDLRHKACDPKKKPSKKRDPNEPLRMGERWG